MNEYGYLASAAVIGVLLVCWFQRDWRFWRLSLAGLRSLLEQPGLSMLGVLVLGLSLFNRFVLAWIGTPRVYLPFYRLITAGGSGINQWLQAHATPALTAFFGAMYMPVSTVLPLAVAASLVIRGERKRSLHMAYSILISYVITVACYVFLPIPETWFVEPQVARLLLTVFPAAGGTYQRFVGLYNCFPSYHTLLPVLMTLLTLRWGPVYRRLTYTLALLSGCIILSTLYLGIHWWIDIVGGIALAVLVDQVTARAYLKQLASSSELPASNA